VGQGRALLHQALEAYIGIADSAECPAEPFQFVAEVLEPDLGAVVDLPKEWSPRERKSA